MALLEARSPTLRGPPPNGRRAGEPNSASAPTGLAHRSVGRPTRCAPKVHGVAVGVASMTRRPSGSDFFKAWKYVAFAHHVPRHGRYPGSSSDGTATTRSRRSCGAGAEAD